MAKLIFYCFSLLLLLVMIYVMWSGVGSKRPAIGRGFAVIGLGLAAYIGWLLLKMVR